MKPSEISVDIVVLSWGRIPDTCLAIDSALAQKGVTVRVVVIDQGSSAEDLAVLKSHVADKDRVTLVCNDRNLGVPGGRNQGTALGSAPYIVALDNDAEFASEDEVARAVGVMQSDASIAALAFRIVLFSNGQDDRSSWPYSISMEENAGRRFATARFVGAGHMLKRSVFESVGCYDEKLIFLHEEVDLSYRLMNSGSRIVYEPSVRVRHKVGQENRVSWSGKRYYFHIRNTIYMAAKYNFSPVSSTLNAGVAILRGLRSGYVKGTLQGILFGLALVPTGLRQRWFDRRVRMSAESRTRIKATSPTSTMSLTQKIRYRLAPGARSAQ